MTADVFPVVTNTCTKSIQKQVESIDVDIVGGKKHLASKSVLFRVELIASSYISRSNLQASETECCCAILLKIGFVTLDICY